MKITGRITGVPALEKKLASLGVGLTREEADAVGEAVIEGAKTMIARGSSPIRGGSVTGRFPAYKNPESYPGKRKPKTPVNLTLTGKFLNAFRHKVVSAAGESLKGFIPEIGFFSDKEALKEQGHREGANGQPSRPIIPNASIGERWAATIEDKYMRIVRDAFRRRSE